MSEQCTWCDHEISACPYHGCAACHEWLDTIDGVTNTHDPCCAPCHPCCGDDDDAEPMSDRVLEEERLMVESRWQGEDYYPGCAMPVGLKAAFWRQYFQTNLRERIQARSIMDEVLQELARCEERVLALQAYADVAMRALQPSHPHLSQAAREVLAKTGYATLPQFEEARAVQEAREHDGTTYGASIV